MIRFVPLVVLLAAAPLQGQPAPSSELSLEHRMLLRCSAAFALVAQRQAAGEAAALAYPPLRERGGEFRASARVMDEAGLDRAGITAALTEEARDLLKDGTLTAVMPVCLSALEAAGL